MYDLIWVGNTLYPRWFVFAVIFGVVVLAATLIEVLRWACSQIK
jgi:hypothetical protein